MKKYLLFITLNYFFSTAFSQISSDSLKTSQETKIFGSKLEVISGKTSMPDNQKNMYVFSAKYENYSIGESDTSVVQTKLGKHVFGIKMESYYIKDVITQEPYKKNDIIKEE